MIYALLGFIIGLLNAGILVILAILLEKKIKRTMNQIQSHVSAKGKVLEEQNQEIEEWYKELQEKGI